MARILQCTAGFASFGIFAWISQRQKIYGSEVDHANGLEVKSNEATQCSGCLNTSLKCKRQIEKARKVIKELMVNADCPGLSIAVSVDGSTIWAEGFGKADLENGIPCTPHTVMKIASLSKSITSVIAGHLLESGKLDLDKNIQEYVPYWPDKTFNGEQVVITARMLMSHMSGVRNYRLIQKMASHDKKEEDSASHSGFGFEEYYIKVLYKSVRQAVGIFKDDPLINKPGQKYSYTTHGFILLSAVLEGASNKKFTKLVRQICLDLGLESTCLDIQHKIIYNRARYYTRTASGHIVNTPFTESSFKWAGAGMLSTVTDLVKFGNAMLYCHQQNRSLITNKENSVCLESSSDKNPQNRSLGDSQQEEKDETFSDLSGSMNNIGIFANKSASKGNEIQTKQVQAGEQKHGYLQQNTVKTLWQPVPGTSVSWHPEGAYGMGWQVIPVKSKTEHEINDIPHASTTVHDTCSDDTLPKDSDAPSDSVLVKLGSCSEDASCYAYGHTGATVGASAAFFILPKSKMNSENGHESNRSLCTKKEIAMNGIVVALLSNMQGINMGNIALKIISIFDG